MIMNDDLVLIWFELMNCQFLILFLCLVDQTAQEPVHVLLCTMYKICLKISRLFLKFWTIAISYLVFQQSKLTHKMLIWHHTDRPSTTINYNLSTTTIVKRFNYFSIRYSHSNSVSRYCADYRNCIDQSMSSNRASWPTECWPEITLTGLAPQSTPPRKLESLLIIRFSWQFSSN